MASIYLDIYNAATATTSDLYRMVWVALFKKVLWIRDNGSAGQKAWAANVCNNGLYPTDAYVKGILPTVCANGDVQTNIATIADGTHDALIDYVIGTVVPS